MYRIIYATLTLAMPHPLSWIPSPNASLTVCTEIFIGNMIFMSILCFVVGSVYVKHDFRGSNSTYFTMVPCRIAALKHVGKVAVGMRADLLLFNKDMNLQQTMVAGQIVHSRTGS
jgi:hypothetical protein